MPRPIQHAREVSNNRPMPSMAELRQFLGPKIADLLSDELIVRAYRHAEAARTLLAQLKSEDAGEAGGTKH